MSEPEQAAADPWESVPADSVPAGQQQQQQLPPGYGYPQPGMMPQYYYPGYQARRTNGLAIASLVCGICGFLYLIPAFLGIIFGCVALSQIKRQGTDGRGLAIAGIATGSSWLGLILLLIVMFIGAH